MASTTAFDAVVIHDSVGISWILVCTFFVLSMQLGFAMLEVGSVREPHRKTVLVKNMLDSLTSCIVFWLYVKIFSPSIMDPNGDGVEQYHLRLFHWAFCTTAVTICSGAMAERTHMGAYLAYSVVMAGFIYPMVAEGAWGTEDSLLSEFFRSGLDNEYTYHDFAGSGVVHTVGGVSALVGNFFLGRRIMKPESDPQSTETLFGRSDQHAPRKLNAEEYELDMANKQEARKREMLLRPDEGWDRRLDNPKRPERDEKEFKAQNYLQVMGMFTLWVGWYGFNTGSTLGLDRPSTVAVGIVAWNTSLAAAAGGIGALLVLYFIVPLLTLLIQNCRKKSTGVRQEPARKSIDIGFICNGVLGGLVAITASCDVAQDYSALIAGSVAGLFVLPVCRFLMECAHLDDAVDAVPVHAGCGAWGVLFVAFCRPECDYLEANGGFMDAQERFCAEDFSIVQQLVAQAFGMLGIVLWTASTSLVLWFIFVISERTRAEEVHYLDEALALLEQETEGEPGAGRTEQWKRILQYSPLARRVCKANGWTAEGFPVLEMPNSREDGQSITKLKDELEDIKHAKAETALEEAWCLERIAYFLHKCWPLRELAKLRLRVSPYAELSGLGAADAQGARFKSVEAALVEVTRRLDSVQTSGRGRQGRHTRPLPGIGEGTPSEPQSDRRGSVGDSETSEDLEPEPQANVIGRGFALNSAVSSGRKGPHSVPSAVAGFGRRPSSAASSSWPNCGGVNLVSSASGTESVPTSEDQLNEMAAALFVISQNLAQLRQQQQGAQDDAWADRQDAWTTTSVPPHQGHPATGTETGSSVSTER